MPQHGLRGLRWLSLLLVPATVACAHGEAASTGELTIVLDTTAARPGVVVVALPLDPATLTAGSPPVADTVARLDTAFQRLRDSLNGAAATLSVLDRRTADYARRYDEFNLRASIADSLRSQRDRLRRPAAGSARPAAAMESPATLATLHAVHDGTRQAQTVVASVVPVHLVLPAGRWWVGIETTLAALRPITIVAGARDTIRVP